MFTIMCQCPLRAGPHFYSTFLRPNVYKGFRSIFSAHFSEYSDISQKQGVKVGKARIVFIRIQFGIFPNVYIIKQNMWTIKQLSKKTKVVKDLVMEVYSNDDFDDIHQGHIGL